ncbi:MAG: hypothetical protein ACRC3B_19875 [Bacteroidia bacterium]
MTQFAQELAAHTGRLRGQTGADRETPLKPSVKPQPDTGSDSFNTWRSIRFRNSMLLILVPLAALTFYVLALSVSAIAARIGQNTVHIIGLGAIAAWTAYLTADYFRFRNWRKRLPFQVAGWNDVVNHTAFEAGLWRHAQIKLVYNENTKPEEEKHFAAGLIVFAHLANTSYGERFENDPRHYWNTDLNVASGSVNVSVAARIIGLCTKKLTHTAQRYPGKLQRVEITLSGIPFEADLNEDEE